MKILRDLFFCKSVRQQIKSCNLNTSILQIALAI
jgi:hypothetical protein